MVDKIYTEGFPDGWSMVHRSDATNMEDRPYKIDGYPVSKQELLDQATMIRDNPVRSVGLAARTLREEGRDVELD